MRAFKQMKSVISDQLFAHLPVEYEKGFRDAIYHTNMQRFATQCFFLVVLDILSLLVYLSFCLRTNLIIPEYIAVHIIKIMIMGLGFYFYSKTGHADFAPSNFIYKNMDVIYPMLHFIFEFCLFYFSTQTLGPMIRFLSVPFIVGGIPILKQSKIFVLEVLVIIAYILYLPTTPYGQYIELTGMLANLGIVFLCVNLISFIVYSANLHNYVLTKKEAQAKEELAVLAKQDQLTKLHNRHWLNEYLEESWNAKPQKHQSISIMMIDIDYFKNLNDAYGHIEGDRCISEIAEAIQGTLNEEKYMLARYGGEEFITVAYDCDHHKFVAMGERIRKKVQSLHIPNQNSNVSAFVTVSIGIATQKIDAAESYNTVINWADECLYFAKNTGKNHVVHTEDKRSTYHPDKEIQSANRSSKSINRSSRSILSSGYLAQFLNDNENAFIYYKNKKSLHLTTRAAALFKVAKEVSCPDIRALAITLSIHPEDRDDIVNEIQRNLAKGAPAFSTEFRIEDKETQQSIWVAMQVKCIYSSSNQIEVIYGAIFNLGTLKKYHRFLNENRALNSVTRLPNREEFHATLSDLLECVDQSGYLVLFDIDDFKAINGFHGHSTGNHILNQVGQTLLSLSDGIRVFHYAIDQFVFIAVNADKEQTDQLIDKVQKHFNENPIHTERVIIKVEFTIAAVPFSNIQNRDEMLANLDIALQIAKRIHRRDRFFFTDKERQIFLENVNLEKDIKAAILNNFAGFMLYYQPLIHAETGKISGAEALLRWENQDGNIIPPDKIIPALERIDFMPTVERWILDAACKQCARFISDSMNEDFYIHINLNPYYIARTSLRDEILESINKYNLQKKNICLEVTESSTLNGVDSSISVLEKLHADGIHIAIDDFGTGFSSLSYMHLLPIHQIKIDRSFILDAGTSLAARNFLGSIVGLVKSMGYEVCLEGIETQEQLDAILPMGLNYIQGFYFGKPMPSEEFKLRLSKTATQ